MSELSADNASELEAIPINPEEAPSAVLEIIYELRVKDVMNRAVITGRPGDSLRKLQAVMKENYIDGVPIVDDGEQLAGIISIDDIITALEKGHIDRPARDKMTTAVISLTEDMPLSFAISYLNRYRYGRFPVLNRKNRLVGVLSPKDVVRSMLVEMNRQVLRLEKLHEAAPAHKGTKEMEFSTVRYDFELAGRASTEFKKALKQRNIDPAIIRRAAIASYELEINQVVHSEGGTISCSIQNDRVVITAVDRGPGIEDVNRALMEGYSTANDWIRSLGFGAGMGLANARRVSDEFSIESARGAGTTVRTTIYITSPKEGIVE
ncbi:MAG: CBS domain-containing protein [Spirochaetaceae bacterium]|jgi:CBS domain-containing protein/anti-sigma regulatory factor (Ser/Thr protein kinase)|nr:CBS domain-containing protein [Spirochaetaceae bacterium]